MPATSVEAAEDQRASTKYDGEMESVVPAAHIAIVALMERIIERSAN